MKGFLICQSVGGKFFHERKWFRFCKVIITYSKVELMFIPFSQSKSTFCFIKTRSGIMIVVQYRWELRQFHMKGKKYSCGERAKPLPGISNAIVRIIRVFLRTSVWNPCWITHGALLQRDPLMTLPAVSEILSRNNILFNQCFLLAFLKGLHFLPFALFLVHWYNIQRKCWS